MKAKLGAKKKLRSGSAKRTTGGRETVIETVMSYPAELETQYLEGRLFSRWKEKYGHTELFLEINPLSKQFPLQCPPLPSQTYGFGELFVGIHYLNRGYEVIRHYWYKDETYAPYKIAVALMGQEAADYVSNQNKKPHTQPPDLLVYKKGRMRQVVLFIPTATKILFPNWIGR